MLLFCAAQIVSDLFLYYYATLTEEMDDEGNSTDGSIEDVDGDYYKLCKKLATKAYLQRVEIKSLKEQIAEEKDLQLTMQQHLQGLQRKSGVTVDNHKRCTYKKRQPATKSNQQPSSCSDRKPAKRSRSHDTADDAPQEDKSVASLSASNEINRIHQLEQMIQQVTGESNSKIESLESENKALKEKLEQKEKVISVLKRRLGA